jgi:hypothetical protein
MINHNKRIVELIEIAKSATPGRWTYDSCGDINANSVSDAIGTTLFYSSENVDAKFIATFNPALVLKLLESLKEMREGLTWIAGKSDKPYCTYYERTLGNGQIIPATCDIANKILTKADKVFE